MPFLNLGTFSALFIVSGMAFQRMLPRKAREFMPKDVVLVLVSFCLKSSLLTHHLHMFISSAQGLT